MTLRKINQNQAMKDIVDSLRLLVNQNILTKIEGSIDESSCQLAILPTILLAVSNEKVDAIYSMVFQNDPNTDEAPKYAPHREKKNMRIACASKCLFNEQGVCVANIF